MALNITTLGLSATVTAQGISAPDYQTILSTLTSYFQQIYGADAYLEPDSKDGQLVAITALAVHDANNTAIACYNSFSPSTAMSEALTRNVKINGISRKGATNSTVDITLTGTPGTTINSGSVRDDNSIVWNLPASVTIGTDGTVIVTATCSAAGTVSAMTGSVNQINTPTRGWVSATNATAASVGVAAESDAELRQRQTRSVAGPSQTIMEGIIGAVSNCTGVSSVRGYDNDSEETDSNGVPAHALALVVDGGDADEIARVYALKKTPGVPTYGDTAVIVTDSYGNNKTINFFRPTKINIYCDVHIKALAGYTSDIGNLIKEAISDYINSLGAGDSVYLSRLYVPASLSNSTDGETYDILSIEIGINGENLNASNLMMKFNDQAVCLTENIIVTPVI